MSDARSRFTFSHAFCFVVFVSFSVRGILSSKIVTLESIEIFSAHEFLPTKPTVFFQCNGEKRTILPDVTEVHFLYLFKGEESWQPLTELPDNKCRRCGLYERDLLKPPDVYDEWELCSSDFIGGKYVHFKENEFNATFSCPECGPLKNGPLSSRSEDGAPSHRMSIMLIIIISVVISAIVFAGLATGYKCWLRRKRQQDQARFLKLFEEGDDIEDELGLEPV